MSEDQMQVDIDRLPPMIQKHLHALEADRKKLMKDKGFNDPEQLRGFIGTFLYPRMIETTKILSAAAFDVYELATSNMNQHRRFAAQVVSELNELGSDIDHDGPLPGVSADFLDDLQQALYRLAGVLEKKLPDDKEAQAAFNDCAKIVSDMQAELTGEPDEPREDEEGEDGVEPESDVTEPGIDRAQSTSENAPKEPERE
jgi:hypothetical protein